MAAKSYNRTVRAHKFTYEALWTILWDKFVNWAEDSSVDINPDIMEAAKSVANEMSDKSSANAVHDQVNKLEEILADTDTSGLLKEYKKDRSPSFTYWRQYMELVSLLLQFIRVERTAKCKLHLSAFADMFPWFAIYDHKNYTRWGRCTWLI